MRMRIGESLIRVDAHAKVTGQAKFTGDLLPRDCLYAAIVHADCANGRVLSIDGSAAEKVPGFVQLVTSFDVPDTRFPTAGHPWSVEKAHQDIADRPLLTKRVRLYGDYVAAVIGETRLAAKKAAALVKVEYETYPPLLTAREALGATPLHEEFPDNLIAHSRIRLGMSYDEAKASEPEALEFVKRYDTQIVQHCHLEPAQTLAYMEGERIVVVSSTQIPHIIRRIVSQALDMPMGRIRVIKPCIGGGFGNKQDALVEPLAAYLTTRVGGRPVFLELSREETFTDTRVRHPMSFDVKALVRRDGTLLARKVEGWSAQGGYASHGHSVVANSASAIKQLYRDALGLECDVRTVYTTTPVAGAMRAYGIPQADFLTESLSDDIALVLGMDPIEFRMKNKVEAGYVDPHSGITFHSYGLEACIEKGRAAFDWDKKRIAYSNQQGPIRRGVGMAMFIYKTGVHPISLETAGARVTLNQDGSVMVQMGATEIGQGADTVFTQMAAQVLGISPHKVHLVSTQDTDIAPYDSGAYASRQTYVSGGALKRACEMLKEKIIGYAREILGDVALDLRDDGVVEADTGVRKLTLEELALEAQYSLRRSEHLTAEYTNNCKDNTFSSGVGFAEVEVDIPLCKVKVLRILNVHDSGVLINPQLAAAQVHGGMSMGMGYGLSEELLLDQSGRPLNGNLLDYKLPTAMDHPDLETDFVELVDPTGPFGNKALGEPPAIPPAPAIRNAVLHATGVAVDSLPLSPQKLYEHFVRAGLIREGEEHV